MLCDVQDAERRQAEARAKQQQRQKEMEAAQQEAQERRQLLEEQKLFKLAGMLPSSSTAQHPHCTCQSLHVSVTACVSHLLGRRCVDCTLYCMPVALCAASASHQGLEACMFVMKLLGCLQGESTEIMRYHVNLIFWIHLLKHAAMQVDFSSSTEQVCGV